MFPPRERGEPCSGNQRASLCAASDVRFAAMDEQAARDILSGERRGICAAILRAGLAVGSVPYAVAVRLRRWGYRKGILASRSAGEAHGAQAVGLRAVPVISVGNITTGGTGKTPMVAWVVQHLREGGRRPAILMRGYKATGGKSDEIGRAHV